QVAHAVGFTAVVEAAGTTFMALEDHPYALYFDKDWTAITDGKLIPAMLDPTNPAYDHFINVPSLKNHEQVPNTNVDFTCCLKNFVGLITWNGPNSRVGEGDIHTADLGTKVGEMGRFVPKITMNVVDALSPVLTNGPAGWVNSSRDVSTGLSTRTMDLAPEAGLVIASADRVAADALAFATLKYFARLHGIDRPYLARPVGEQSQLKRAAELGLGTHLLSALDIVSDNVTELDAILAEWG
ncbi:MAG: DUF362 domain-containing protein, partial [Deltaproteobacteria bacterium]|nr:DUF362 domain-containing protein [Deltaproteobacteria bacterium]